MLNDIDLLADLPPLRDDEPSSLRQDIADELADHLGCAFHRELVKSGDAETARRRVLDRFGDPQRIARQLWWQAMWSHIMLKRIGLGLQVSLLAALLVSSVVMLRAMNHMPTAAQLAELRQQSESNRQMLAAVLERLPAPVISPDGSGSTGMMPSHMSSEGAGSMAGGPMGGGMMSAMSGGMGLPMETPSVQAADYNAGKRSSLTIKFVTDVAEGLPLPNGTVTVLDESLSPIPIWLQETFVMEHAVQQIATGQLPEQLRLQRQFSGVAVCPFMKPGRYQIRLVQGTGLVGEMRVIIRPNEQKQVTFIAPESSPERFVTIAAPEVPEDLRDIVTLRLNLHLNDEPSGSVIWRQDPHRSWILGYSGKSRLVQGITTQVQQGQGPNQTLRMLETQFQPNEPEADRFVTLFDGKFEMRWTIRFDSPSIPSGSFGYVVELPNDDGSLRQLLCSTRDVSASVTHWDCSFSEDVWKQVRAEHAKYRVKFIPSDPKIPVGGSRLE